MPKVSVLMPVYNGEKYIKQAIDSILAQSFSDFELLVIDDGSTDRSAEIVSSYRDERIRYVANATNLGLAGARNRAIEAARGEYLAWLDCDDISLPRRLEKQVRILDSDPRIGVCGTWVETIDGIKANVWRYPTDSQFLRARMLFDDPFATSSIMMRAVCVRDQELRFNLNHPPAEDYELWERVSRDWALTNIPEVLTQYRIHGLQTSVIKAQKLRESVWSIQNCLLAKLGIEASPEEMRLHLDIGVGWRYLADMDRVADSERWLLRLESANRERNIFPQLAFRRVLAERWMHVAGALISKGLIAWSVYHRSKLSWWAEKRPWRALRLFVRCLVHG